MLKIVKSGKSKYLKPLLVALIIVGLLGMYVIPQHFAYGTEGATHTVEFFDFNNNTIKKVTVDWGTGVTPPSEAEANLPEGLIFTGWSTDLKFVTQDLVVWPRFEQEAMQSLAGPDTGEDSYAEIQAASDEGFFFSFDSGPDRSDLSYFLANNGLKVTDTNGAAVSTYYYGQDYNFEIKFDTPSFIDGTLYKPQLDRLTDGFLYFRLPDGLVVTSGENFEGTLDGIPNGKYWIETDIDDEGYPYTYIKAYVPPDTLEWYSGFFAVEFLANFEGTEDGKEFDFGNNLTVTMTVPEVEEEKPVVEKAELGIEKAADDFDYTDNSITYTVTITAKKGNPAFNHTYDWIQVFDRNTYTNKAIDFLKNPHEILSVQMNGVDIDKPRVAYYHDWAEHGPNDLEFHFAEPGEDFGLKEGDVLVIKYKVQFDEVLNSLDTYRYDLTFTNSIWAFDDHTGTQAYPVSTNIKREFNKSAAAATVDGEPAVQWTVVIGDGRTDLRGVKLEEMIDPAGLNTETLYDVMVNYYSYYDAYNGGLTGDKQMSNFKAGSMAFEELFPGNVFTIGDHFHGAAAGVNPATAGIYYMLMTFTTKFTDDVPKTINNKLGMTIGGQGWETIGTYNRPTPPSYQHLIKNGEILEAGGTKYLDWKIEYTVPASAYGSNLYFLDQMFLSPTGNEADRIKPIYDNNADYHFVVTAVTLTDGEPGEPFILEEGADYELVYTKENREWELHIIDTDKNERLSPFTKDTIITITYRLPFDMPVYQNRFGYTTLEEAARVSGADIENWVTAYSVYSHTAADRLKYPIKKTQYNNDAYTIRYHVEINSDGKTVLPAAPLVLEDTFNSDLMVFAGDLTVQRYTPGSNVPLETSHFNANAKPTITDNKNGTSTIKIDFASTSFEPAIQYNAEDKYIVLYNLKLKESIEPGVREIRNTASIGGYSSTFTTNVGKPAATKEMIAADGGAAVDVSIVFNEDARTYDGDPYLAKDVMSDRLFLIEDTIKFWKLVPGTNNWEEVPMGASFDSGHSFTYQVIDPHRVNFWLPDSTTVKVTYKAFVYGENGQTYQISNTVDVYGNLYSKRIDNFRLVRHQGSGYFTKQEFKLIKSDLLSNETMSGVEFVVYINTPYDKYEENALSPGLKDYASEKTIGGKTYYVLAAGETGDDGSILFAHPWFVPTAGVTYALYEMNTPDGYEAPANEGLIKHFTFNMDTAIAREADGIEYASAIVGAKNVPKTTDVTVSGKKVVQGPAGSSAAGYEFRLTEINNSTDRQQKTDVVALEGLFATSDAAGNFTFDTIVNLRAENDGSAKDYYFKVEEIVPVPRDPDMVYAESKVAKVTVQGAADGGVEVTSIEWLWFASPSSVTDNTFVNRAGYEPTSVVLKAKKTAAGKAMTNEQFSFRLFTYESYTREDGTQGRRSGEEIAASNGIVSSSDNSAWVEFKEVYYTEKGDYFYLVQETSTDSDGWTVDTNVYFIWVLVTDFAGRLEARISYASVDYLNDTEWTVNDDWVAGWPVFENTYTPNATTLPLSGTKVGEGRLLTDGQFSFTVTDKNGQTVANGTNAADGKVTFDPAELTYSGAGDYEYTVAETALAEGTGWAALTAPITFYVEVVDNNGTLTATAYSTYAVGAYSGPITNIAEYLTFTNAFTPDETTLPISGTKAGEGRALTDGQFSFTVADKNGQTVASGTNNAGGAITFEPAALTYSGPGNHEYTVTETTLPAGTGWAALTAPITFYVEVVNVNGTLTANAYAGYSNGVYSDPITDIAAYLTFTNAYSVQPTSLTISGLKDTGGVPMKAGQFSFSVMEGTEKVASGTNDTAGKITFTPAFEYDAAGLHTYVISEDDPGAGWESNTGAKTVYVNVVDNGDGTLTATAHSANPPAAGNAIASMAAYLTFDNTYEAEGAITFTGTKLTGGIEVEQEMFTFLVTKNGATAATGYNEADGSITFTEITYTYADAGKIHAYLITEDVVTADGWSGSATGYPVYVKVTDNGDGTLTANAYSDPDCTIGIANLGVYLTFVNLYETSGELNLFGTKTANVTPLTNGQFTFTVTEGEEVVSRGVSNDGGRITFTGIPYTQVGDHVYVITEDAVRADGWNGDASRINIYVRVSDDGRGNLTAAAYSDPAYTQAITSITEYLTFNNTYDAAGRITLNGIKTVTGAGAALTAGMFTFVITENGEVIGSATNAANGSFSFPAIEYGLSDVGTHTYIITESAPLPAGWTAKTLPVSIVVKVTDNGDGTLSAKAYANAADETAVSNTASVIAFVNEYGAQGSLTLSGIKNTGGVPMEGRQFSFMISENDEDVAAGWNTDGGVIVFPAIDYTAAGKHTYVISERTSSGSGWTVDANEFTVYVNVTDDGEGNLTAIAYSDEGFTVEIDALFLTFENEYTAAGELVFEGTKNTGTRAMTEGQFKFTANGSDKKTATGENDADGLIVFTKLSYDYSDIGVHSYIISENTPGPGWENMTAPITVFVKVADNHDGTLSVNVYSDAECTNLISDTTELLRFTNKYEAQGSIGLTGTKTANTPIIPSVFSFTIYEGDTVVSRGTNDGGFITFDDILYDSDGEHTYVIREDAASVDGWTADATAHTIKVVVTDDGEGNLTATAYDAAGEEITNIALALTFENTYSASVSLDLEGAKTVNSGAPVTGFTFEVKEGDEVVTTGLVTGSGDISFGTINYDYSHVGDHAYTISEVLPGLGWTDATGPIQIFVRVTDEGGGALSAKAYSDSGYTTEITNMKSLLTFSNIYRAEGDITFAAVKKAVDGVMTGGMFSFTITEVTAEGETEIFSGTNNAEGEVIFGGATITYKVDGQTNQLGRYVYRIEEVLGAALPAGWTSDTLAKTVYVEVTDTGAGTLSVVAYENADYSGPIADLTSYLTFVNTYDAAGELVLEGIKEVTGRDDMEADEFSFTVIEITADGEEVVSTGANDEEGNILFDRISYTLGSAGHHEYVISENPAGENWTANTEPVTIYVNVTDNGSGALIPTLYASYTPGEEGEPGTYSDEITDVLALLTFDNTFTPVTQLIISKALEGEELPAGMGSGSEFRVRIMNVSTDEYLTFEFFPAAEPPTYIYTGEAPAAEDETTGPDTWITISAGNPALISGIPAGLTLMVEELDGDVFGWVLDTEVTYPGGADSVSIAAMPVDEEPAEEPPADEEPPAEDGTEAEAEQGAQEVIVTNSYQPIAVSVEVDIDTIRRTSAAFNGEPANVLIDPSDRSSEPINNVADETYRYDLNFRSTANVDADEFVVDDPLEAVNQGLIRLEGLWTPTVWGDMDGKMNVWYKTAGGAGISATPAAQVTTVDNPLFPTDPGEWKLWTTIIQGDFDIDSQPLIKRVRLSVEGLGLGDDYITALRFEYGAVKKGFTSCNTNLTQSNQAPGDGIRNTNGVDEFMGDLASLATPAGADADSGQNPAQATGALIAPFEAIRNLFAFIAFADEMPVITMQSEPADDIPGKGAGPNWAPVPGRSDYAPELAGVSGLMPATYLVSAPNPLDTGSIITSVSALIGLTDVPTDPAGSVMRLFDKDQDAVLTRVITPIKTEFTEEGYGSLEEMNSFLQIPRFEGLTLVNGQWVDGNGNRVVPRTGDVFALSMWIILSLAMVVCMGFLLWTFFKKRKKRTDEEGVSEAPKGGAVK